MNVGQREPPPTIDTPTIDTSLVECIVVGVPDADAIPSVAAALAELAEGAAVRILDLVAVTRDRTSRTVRVLEVDEVDGMPDHVLVEAQIGGLLSENDIALAAAALLPGSACVLVLVEDRWAEILSSAARRAGGRVIGGERIPRTRIEAALAESPSTRGQEGRLSSPR